MNTLPQTLPKDSIGIHKYNYHLFTPITGRRYEVIWKLKEFIEDYQPILKKVNKKGFDKNYLSSYDELSKKIKTFLMTHFPEVVWTHFKSLPKSQPRTGHLGLDVLNTLLTPSFREYKKKIIEQEQFLVSLKNCLEDYGLHEDIKKRSPFMYARYLVSITHDYKTKRRKKLVSKFLTETEMKKEFLTPYLDRDNIFMKENPIPYANISSFRIARTLMQDDELILFRQKNKITEGSIKGLFDKIKDVTDTFVTTTKVNHNFTVAKDLWNMVHPILRPKVKPHIKSRQYDKAVLTAFIELNDIIKKAYKAKTGIEEDGVSLMNKAFSPRNPVFQLTPDLNTTSGENEQRGLMFKYSGAMTAIRNPLGHENRILTQNDALYKIFDASFLLHAFEQRQK